MSRPAEQPFSAWRAVRRGVRRGGVLRELWLDLLALLWPVTCVGCGRADRELCLVCAASLRATPELETEGHSVLGVPCLTAGAYEGVVRATLLAFKHGSAHGFVRPLGSRLVVPLRSGLALAAAGGAGDALRIPALVPLPSRPKRVRERGGKHLNELLGVAIKAGALRAQRVDALKTLPGRTGQVGLDAAARERNASRIAVRRGAAGRLLGREVILVDDILTTGATARAAVALLEAVGVRVIAVVVLCRARRRDTP